MTVTDPEVHTLTGAYACDALTSAEAAAFEQHLAACPTCAEEVGELRETAARLAMAVAEPPPPSLKAAVDARIAVTRQRAPIGVAHPGIAKPRRRRLIASVGWGVAGVLACAVAVLGIRVADAEGPGPGRQAAAIESVLAAPDVRTNSAPVSSGGNAVVLVSRAQDKAAIAVSGLKAPPAGKAYQLWMIGPDGIRSGGLLPTGADGTAGSVVAHGLDGARTISLTLEPAAGSQQPTMSPVLLLAMPY